jgi:hypothetical protein
MCRVLCRGLFVNRWVIWPRAGWNTDPGRIWTRVTDWTGRVY